MMHHIFHLANLYSFRRSDILLKASATQKIGKTRIDQTRRAIELLRGAVNGAASKAEYIDPQARKTLKLARRAPSATKRCEIRHFLSAQQIRERRRSAPPFPLLRMWADRRTERHGAHKIGTQRCEIRHLL